MWRILVTEPLAAEGLDVLRAEATVDINAELTPKGLIRAIGSYDGLLVRSKTRVTADVIAAGKRLGVIGRVGTGVDNVDLDAATRRGIVVVNAPYGNTVSVAEHTLALMLALARHIPRADASLRGGRWARKRSTFSTNFKFESRPYNPWSVPYQLASRRESLDKPSHIRVERGDCGSNQQHPYGNDDSPLDSISLMCQCNRKGP